MDGPSGCTNFGNKEDQWYLPSQDRVSGGALRLVAQPIRTRGQTARGKPKRYRCRSGMVTSYPGFRFRYGYVQVVAWIPAGVGLWPALWLAAENMHWPPEIDMLEHWGDAQGLSAVFLHPVGASQVAARLAPGLTGSWHTFSLLWTSRQLTWYVNGRAVLTVHRHIPHQRMYLIVTLAVNRIPPTGRRCTGVLRIRSVRIFQPRGAAGGPAA
jgi:beta-glucanase (GH16 family)